MSKLTAIAVEVTPKFKVDIEQNEQVLVGVRCVYDGIRLVPVTPGFRQIKNVFDGCDDDELIVIKRIKPNNK